MKVLVIGGNFAGATAAMEIKRKLKNKVDVTLIDRSPDFSIYSIFDLGSNPQKRVTEIAVPREKILAKEV